jgi:hypothetical protein
VLKSKESSEWRGAVEGEGWKEEQRADTGETETGGNRGIVEVGAIGNREEKFERSKIEYGMMGGRPSLKIKLNGIWRNCLLDTGARINVIDEEILNDLETVKIMPITDNIACANGSTLQVKGKTQLMVEINGEKAKMEFVIAKNLSPKIIAGVSLLGVFGIQLKMRNYRQGTDEERCKIAREEEELCTIEAKFGGEVTDEERIQVTLKLHNIERTSELYEVMWENKGVFMANKWDIGKTNILKHTILTGEQPVLVKPYRQPANLEEKIAETIKNLEENGIIERCNSAWNAPLVEKREKRSPAMLGFPSTEQSD